MITSTDLEFRSELTLGELKSNAESIQAFVTERLADYTPEKYVGKADEAKADRAVLNAAEKTLNSKRLELERQYMQPFNKFKEIITDTCKAIKQASGQLDAIVKAEEEREREEKTELITSYWDGTKFELVDISKVFNPKWLNKGTKLKDIHAEIDQIQKQILDDLKVLENFPAGDVPLLKTEYLNTLNITQAMQKAEELKANRERLAKEEQQRREMEVRKGTEEQRKSELKEINEQAKDNLVDDLAAQALGLEIEQKQADATETYALVLKGTPDQLMKVRQFMINNNVTYIKLVDKGNGVYTAE